MKRTEARAAGDSALQARPDSWLKRLSSRFGIRSRVMLYLAVFVAFVILLLWLFQIVFLDSFYRAYKTAQVSKVGDMLIQNIDAEDFSALAEQLSGQEDVCVLLLDADGHQLASVDNSHNCFIHKTSPSSLLSWCQQTQSKSDPMIRLFQFNPFLPGSLTLTALDGQPPEPTGALDRDSGYWSSSETVTVSRERDRVTTVRTWRGERRMLDPDIENTRVTSLLYAKNLTLADGTAATLLLNTQLTPLSSTVTALRRQLLWITVIVLIGALLLAGLISRRVSTPIIETNRAAKELARARYTKPRHGDSYREIAELNTTLSHAAEELGQVEELQHELIANISHDLRTPLTMIGGYAEAMRDIPDENTPENMQIIIDETARLSTLVNELLDFSRMQTGTVEMHPEPFNLTAAISAIVARVGGMTAKDGYTVLFAPDEEFWVKADETRINQVIYNLVGNALTYTGEDKQVTVTQRRAGQHVRIDVRDTGKGIAPDELPLIWNRYYRTKETHKRAIIGSGLGLNIVQSILEKHGAPYGVESSEGAGTTFWFELPLAEEAQGEH